MVGAVSLGGVIMVPAIVHLTGIEIHIVVASVLLSTLFSGSVGTFMYARHGAINWSMATWLGVGALIGAFAGTFVLARLPGTLIEGIVGTFILLTGLHALLARQAKPEGQAMRSNLSLVVVGAVAALGAAVSGAGGPLLLVPILMWMKYPILVAVALGQVIQIPVGISATAGNLINGLLDVKLGLLISVCLMIGVAVGAKISVALPEQAVRRIVAIVLVGTSLVILGRLGFAG